MRLKHKGLLLSHCRQVDGLCFLSIFWSDFLYPLSSLTIPSLSRMDTFCSSPPPDKEIPQIQPHRTSKRFCSSLLPSVEPPTRGCALFSLFPPRIQGGNELPYLPTIFMIPIDTPHPQHSYLQFAAFPPLLSSFPVCSFSCLLCPRVSPLSVPTFTSITRLFDEP